MSDKTVRKIVNSRFAVIQTHHYHAEYCGVIVHDYRRSEADVSALNDGTRELNRLCD